MRSVLFVLFLSSATKTIAQEPFPGLIISTDSFRMNGKAVLSKYRFSTHAFYKDSLFLDNRDDYDRWRLFDLHANPSSISMCLHPFSLDSERLGWVYKGSVFVLRITDLASKRIMRVYFRSCFTLGYGAIILLDDLKFLAGSYFYDMLSSDKRFEIPCPDYDGRRSIKLNSIFKHKIELDSLITLIGKTTALQDSL